VKQAWRDNIDPQSLPQPAPTILGPALELGRAYRLVDWDQAIVLAHELFLDPQNRQEWVIRLQHYLVDEYQDFNRAEQAFIAAIASTITSMVIVGDDNQSIFSSRGGSPDELKHLFVHPANDQVSLQRCRRCKSVILSAANRYLHWMNPAAAPMHPYQHGGSADCYHFKSSKAEIDFLINYLRVKLVGFPANPSSKEGIVCLFPTRKSLAFYYEAIQQNIPSYTGKTDVHPIRNQLALLLELVCNPYQRFIERLLLELFTAIKPRHKLEMVRLILRHDISPSEAIEQLISSSFLSGASLTEGQSFIEMCNNLSSQDPNLVANTISIFFGRKFDEVVPCVENMLNQLRETDQDDLISSTVIAYYLSSLYLLRIGTRSYSLLCTELRG
jgi:superfamily I DNA/RNA helicase